MTNAKRFDNYINGEWVAASVYATNINPSELSDTIGDYAKADLAQVHAAIDAARAAFPAWSTSGIQARHELFLDGPVRPRPHVEQQVAALAHHLNQHAA